MALARIGLGLWPWLLQADTHPPPSATNFPLLLLPCFASSSCSCSCSAVSTTLFGARRLRAWPPPWSTAEHWLFQKQTLFCHLALHLSGFFFEQPEIDEHPTSWSCFCPRLIAFSLGHFQL